MNPNKTGGTKTMVCFGRNRVVYKPNWKRNERKSFHNTSDEEFTDPFILNMDCWLIICQYLSLHDILKLSEISTAYKKMVGKYVLPTQFKNLDIPYYMKFNDIHFILKSVRNTVKKLHFRGGFDDKEFNLLTRFRFPCVTEINIPKTLDNHDMFELSRAFPNLQSLTPSSLRCAWTKILRFRHLESLTLTGAHVRTVSELQEILIGLNLKSLYLDVFHEKSATPLNLAAKIKFSQIHNLKLNVYELNWLSGGVANDINNDAIVYKNLKTLVVKAASDTRSIHNLFRDMQSIVDRDVYEIKCDFIPYSHSHIIHELMVPERYDFLNRVNTLKLDGITLNMPGAPNRYKALRELCLSNIADPWENILLNIFSNAEKLDLLSIEHCVEEIVLNDKHLSALMARKKPITLNWSPDKKLPPEFCSEKYKGLIKFTQKSYRHYEPMQWLSSINIKFRS